MPTTFLLLLVVVPVLAVVLRLTTALPLGRARRVSVLDVVLLVLGAAGLAFHCLAMFFPDQTARVLGTGAAAAAVNAFGTASILLYVVPSLLVLVALRRVWPPALVVLVGSLAAVGITMYASSPLDLHLATIAVAVLVMSSVVAALVRLGPRPLVPDAARAG